jgi:hypothetical protein
LVESPQKTEKAEKSADKSNPGEGLPFHLNPILNLKLKLP